LGLGGGVGPLLEDELGDRQIYRGGNFQVGFFTGYNLHRKITFFKEGGIIGDGPPQFAALVVALFEHGHIEALGGLGSPEIAAIGGALDHLVTVDDFNRVFNGDGGDQAGAMAQVGSAAIEQCRGGEASGSIMDQYPLSLGGEGLEAVIDGGLASIPPLDDLDRFGEVDIGNNLLKGGEIIGLADQANPANFVGLFDGLERPSEEGFLVEGEEQFIAIAPHSFPQSGGRNQEVHGLFLKTSQSLSLSP